MPSRTRLTEDSPAPRPPEAPGDGLAAVPVQAHRLRRMAGRDPHEHHRAATPLELLFDLTFVVAAATAAAEFAHALAANHVGPGLLGFVFATFAIALAWINFSWFASAYDTDDWVYRLATMTQMVGVMILALGVPRLFASIQEGNHVDSLVMVSGYVVMRVALVAQWVRAARQDPARRATCLTYVGYITVAQVGWVALALAQRSVRGMFLGVAVLLVIELAGPRFAERRRGGTPWHAHHIAERYSALIIIALGEGVVGTVASLGAAVGEQGWTVDAVLVAVAGTGLTFAMWWMYHALPLAHLLDEHRDRSFVFGYLNIVVFGAIVAIGAGMHAAAYYIEDHSDLQPAETVLAVAVPVAVFAAAVYAMYSLLVRGWQPVQLLLIILTGTALAASVACAAAGLSIGGCLLIVMLAPVVSVVGFETVGHRRIAEAVGAGSSTNDR